MGSRLSRCSHVTSMRYSQPEAVQDPPVPSQRATFTSGSGLRLDVWLLPGVVASEFGQLALLGRTSE